MGAKAQRHGFQCGGSVDRQLRTPAEALGRSHADSDTGKAARARRHSKASHIRRLFPAALQQILRHGHQSLAMGQAGILIALCQQALAIMERHTNGFGRCFKG